MSMFAYAESIATRNTVIASLRETAAESMKSKPQITIRINGEPDSQHCDRYYTSSDRIEGTVSIVTSTDTRFDEIYIGFEGTSRTWMERFGGSPATSGRSTVNQTFLRLVQPVDESTLPIPRIANKGQTYTFPFTFVIPEQLLPSTCEHSTQNASVNQDHLRLPPSLNDASLNTWDEKDDLTPDMARISYAVRARIIRKRESDGRTIYLSESIRKIPIAPAFDDAPPVHIPEKSKDFSLRKEKDLRRGFLLGKRIGRISVSTEQPKPLRIPLNSACPASTTANLSLSFVSSDFSAPPPELGSLTVKLRTFTFFSTLPQSYIPTYTRSLPDPTVGVYSENTFLSSRCIQNVRWEIQPAACASGKAVYQASIVVPITTPKGKRLVPTFSSCYVSRSYTLEISVSVQTTSHSHPTLTLKVPLQVSQPTKESQDHADMDVEEFFTPRIITATPLLAEAAMVAAEEQQQLPSSMVAPPNQMPPPGYSVFSSVSGVPQRIPEPMGISPGCG